MDYPTSQHPVRPVRYSFNYESLKWNSFFIFTITLKFINKSTFWLTEKFSPKIYQDCNWNLNHSYLSQRKIEGRMMTTKFHESFPYCTNSNNFHSENDTRVWGNNFKDLKRCSTETALQTEDERIRVEEKSTRKKNNNNSTWQDKKTCDPQGEQMNMVLVWYYHITFTIKFGSKMISTFPFFVEHLRTGQNRTVHMIALNRDHELVTYCDIYKNWSHIELLLSLWLPKYSLKWISHIHTYTLFHSWKNSNKYEGSSIFSFPFRKCFWASDWNWHDTHAVGSE